MDLTYELRRTAQLKARRAGRSKEDGDNKTASRLYNECAVLLDRLAELQPTHSQTWRSKSDGFRQLAFGSRSVSDDSIVCTGHREPPEITDNPLAKHLISPSVSFSEIAGLDVAKQRIREAMIYPSIMEDAYRHYDVPIGGGLLMYGPPGCGKTRIAQAAAYESEAVFVELTPSDIKDKYVGESEKNLKAAFQQASGYSRAVVFIDELDSLAGRRSGNGSSHDVSLVAEFLVQLQRFRDQEASFMVIGATNRPWEVDSALRRPGRFDTLVFIPHPDQAARLQLLHQTNASRPLEDSVDFERLAGRLEGYSCSEIIEICNESARLALRDSLQSDRPRLLTQDDFETITGATKSSTIAWYRQTLSEIEHLKDRDVFSDMIESATALIGSTL